MDRKTILRTGVQRLRPVLLTTITHDPWLIAYGVGNEYRLNQSKD